MDAAVEVRRDRRRELRRDRKRRLRELQIRRSWTTNLPLWALVALLLGAVAVAVIAWRTDIFSTDVAAVAVTVFVGLAGVLVALVEWRAGLAEKALDALYARFALANEVRLEAGKGVAGGREAEIAAQQPERYAFYVFTEIDNLEYARVRYGGGLGMNDVIAYRAVRHFQRRCEMSEAFRAKASQCVDIGGYLEETPALVAELVRLGAEHAARATR
jgi:hypothetical protein